MSLTLNGFKPLSREGVLVEVGKTVALTFELRIENLADYVTVAAATPVVDARQTGTATNITPDELTQDSRPRAIRSR